ncbi:MAG: hypothetical protein ACM3H8_05370 [Sphingobacteriales bacterium]
MMKKIIHILCGAVLVLSSCKKDSIVFIPDPGYQLDSAWVNTISDQSKISECVKNIFPPPPPADTTEIFLTDTTFIRSELFDIIIPPGTLKGSTAGDVSGKVNYNFFLLQKKGDFIRLQLSTLSNEHYFLTCGGGFFIRFFRGTEELNIVPGKNIIVSYTEPSPLQNMKVYYGADNIISTTPINTSTGWTSSSTNTYVKPVQRKFNNISSYGYEVSTDKLRWVNAASNISSATGLVNLSVYVPDLFSNANTQAYIVFKDSRTIVKLNGDADSKKFTAPNVPLDKSALIITISKVAQDYFLGAQEIITSDKPIEAKPIIGGLDRILNYLDSL